jgi:hypothetical protein
VLRALDSALSKPSNELPQGLPMLRRLQVGFTAASHSEYYIRTQWEPWVLAWRERTRTVSLRDIADSLGLYYGEHALRSLWAECGALPPLPSSTTRLSRQLARAVEVEMRAVLVPFIRAPGMAEIAARWDAKGAQPNGEPPVASAARFVIDLRDHGVHVYLMKRGGAGQSQLPVPPKCDAVSGAGSSENDPLPAAAATSAVPLIAPAGRVANDAEQPA